MERVVLYGRDRDSRGSEAGASLVWSRGRKKASVAGVERVRRKMVGCPCYLLLHNKLQNSGLNNSLLLLRVLWVD